MFDKNRPVLVADDDVYFRLALTALLRGPLGFVSVIEAGSLDEALEYLSTTDGISLALFDLAMPGMDGPATLAAVRECYPDVLVAVISASENRRTILTALDTGVHGYIPKRFGPNELVRALGIVIGGDIFVPRSMADNVGRTKELAGQREFSLAGSAGQQAAETRTEDDRRAAELVAVISPRQREVLTFLVRGWSNKQIANALSLGEGTVKVHVAALLRHLGVANRAGAAAAGARLFRS